MATLLFTLNALTPLLGLAILGYVIRRLRLVNDDFMMYLNRYIFYIALPALILMTLLNVTDLSDLDWAVIVFVVGMTVVPALVLHGVLHIIAMKRRYKPVLLQAFFRGNFVLIGVPLAQRLGGLEAVSIVVLLNVFMVPLTNTMSIVYFQLWDETAGFTKEKLIALLRSIFLNPLMIAFFIGIIGFLVREPLGVFNARFTALNDTLELIAITASPMAMIAIGGQFKYQQTVALKAPIIAGTVLRLVVLPVIAFSGMILLSDRIDFSLSYAALIALFASPVGVSSVAVTKGLNGDEELASQLVIWTTGFAVITLFIVVSLFRYFGLL